MNERYHRHDQYVEPTNGSQGALVENASSGREAPSTLYKIRKSYQLYATKRPLNSVVSL